MFRKNHLSQQQKKSWTWKIQENIEQQTDPNMSPIQKGRRGKLLRPNDDHKGPGRQNQVLQT